MRKEDRNNTQASENPENIRAFSLFAPASDTPVMFSSPHSGSYYPPEFRRLIRVPLMDLRRMEDAYVDELFGGVKELGGGLISSVYARAFVDLNRSETELDSRMFLDGPPNPPGERSPRVEAGLGCIPRISANGEEIHGRKLSRQEAAKRLSHAYTPYHVALSNWMERLKRLHGFNVLVDCHSMPSVVGGRKMMPDIVIGTRHGSACDETLARQVESSFVRRGYRVLRNAPYAGGYLTQKYGRPLEDCHALQIEINRRLYMDEMAVELKPGFARVRDDLMGVAADIIDWAKQKKSRAIKARQKS